MLRSINTFSSDIYVVAIRMASEVLPSIPEQRWAIREASKQTGDSNSILFLDIKNRNQLLLQYDILWIQDSEEASIEAWIKYNKMSVEHTQIALIEADECSKGRDSIGRSRKRKRRRRQRIKHGNIPRSLVPKTPKQWP